MGTLMDLFNRLPTLKKHKSENVAAILGFLFGGIGLAIYFWSIIDLLFPVVVVIVLSIALKGGGWLIGAIFASFYGWFRARSSNESIDKAVVPPPPPGAPVTDQASTWPANCGHPHTHADGQGHILCDTCPMAWNDPSHRSA